MLLVSNSLTLRRDKSILYSRVVIINFFYSIIFVYSSYYLTFLGTGLGLYGGLFHISSITHSFHLFIFILTSVILILTGFYSKKVYLTNYLSLVKLVTYKLSFYNTGILNKMSEMYKILEYPLIILFIINGALFLVSASDLVSIFISIELQSYGIYILSAIYKNSEQATSGALMYFLLGGLSSCFILLGTSLLYANSGTTNLDNIDIIGKLSTMLISDPTLTVADVYNYNLNVVNDLNITDEHERDLLRNMHKGNGHLISDLVYSSNVFSFYNSNYIYTSLIIMVTGFLFKVSAAPFHFWSPDVYDAIPTVVTTFVAIIAKISIFIFLLQLVNQIGRPVAIWYDGFSHTWRNILLISSLLSLVIGTVLGLSQSRIKRLYAYSTISHLGFILLGLSIHTVESIQAFMFYLIQYSLSNLNAFILLLTIGYTYYNYQGHANTSSENKFEESGENNINESVLKDSNNSPIQLIKQLKGYFNVNPILALSLSITLFSFAGIPPLMGFFGKMMILSAAINKGYVFMSLVAILTSVIGAGYYLFIIKEMYFEKSDYTLSPKLLGNNITFTGIINKRIFNLEARDNKINNIKTSFNEKFTYNNVVISNYLSIIISILTLLILLYIFFPNELLNITCILVLILFKI